MKAKQHLELYLERYAESEIDDVAKLKRLPIKDYALIVPVYSEAPDFLERWQSHPDAHRTLLILIVNAPERDANNVENSALINWINKKYKTSERSGRACLFSANQLNILMLDRTADHALPDKQGVGLARKIGADVACYLYQKKTIASQILFCTDADAHLPANYFFCESVNGISAWHYGFEHTAEDTRVLEATRIYESCIHYYRRQLEFAGSLYAYHSLGSCIAINAIAYAQVRGFPKRAAGEDFYLLNKLVKVGKIEPRYQSSIKIDARLSTRVPFGTGPGVAKILAQLDSGETPTYYNRLIFTELKSVIANAENYFTHAETISDLSSSALQDADFERFRQSRIRTDKTAAQFASQFHHWFDAFQTLKFVRRLQAHYPDEKVSVIFEKSS